ncbi:hypothetical protein EJ08DRAFT_697993 [Tothia fuscella]|uniref:Uncharacterized protein n=1 Tax=Tothia fuscella TaxID=1048955 RepID=A0A9P4NQ90_9PEZI|nr:hypothetical protein EJ08DRAFT_697993 [Tothia fuscella]
MAGIHSSQGFSFSSSEDFNDVDNQGTEQQATAMTDDSFWQTGDLNLDLEGFTAGSDFHFGDGDVGLNGLLVNDDNRPPNGGGTMYAGSQEIGHNGMAHLPLGERPWADHFDGGPGQFNRQNAPVSQGDIIGNHSSWDVLPPRQHASTSNYSRTFGAAPFNAQHRFSVPGFNQELPHQQVQPPFDMASVDIQHPSPAFTINPRLPYFEQLEARMGYGSTPMFPVQTHVHGKTRIRAPNSSIGQAQACGTPRHHQALDPITQYSPLTVSSRIAAPYAPIPNSSDIGQPFTSTPVNQSTSSTNIQAPTVPQQFIPVQNGNGQTTDQEIPSTAWTDKEKHPSRIRLPPIPAMSGPPFSLKSLFIQARNGSIETLLPESFQWLAPRNRSRAPYTTYLDDSKFDKDNLGEWPFMWLYSAFCQSEMSNGKLVVARILDLPPRVADIRKVGSKGLLKVAIRRYLYGGGRWW